MSGHLASEVVWLAGTGRVWIGVIAFSLLMSACVQPGLHPPPLDSAEATQGSVVEISSKLSRAREALFEGRSVDARDTYVAAVRESSGDPRAILGLAEAHLALGETERAGQILASVNDRRSGINTARLKQARGIVALRLEQPEKARRLLEQSVDADASLWRAWMALGRARLIGNQPHAAQEAFLMAEQVAPRSASAHNDIGMAYLRLENADAAISHFERALQISPAHELAQANLRIVKAMKGDYSGAMVGVPASQRHHALNNVGYVALMNGEFSIADRYLRHAIELSPTHHQTAAANLELIPN